MNDIQCTCGQASCRDGDSSFSKTPERCAADVWAFAGIPQFEETAKFALTTRDRDNLLRLGYSADSFVRANVAMNPETPTRLLGILGNDPDGRVRAALALRTELDGR